ncbi:hypothetical protein VCRA2119O245_230031 [Vibrio crassostreae]|nr:hypothetical protein VCRA2119O245_230031 [Vibrio crassostreae]
MQMVVLYIDKLTLKKAPTDKIILLVKGKSLLGTSK